MPGWLRDLSKWIVKVVGSRVGALITSIDKAWDGVGKKLAKPRNLADAMLATVIVLYLAVDVARTSLDNGIRKIHPAGVNGVSTNSLHNGPTAIRRAFNIWDEGYNRLNDPNVLHPLLSHRPVTLATAQTLLELVLVPLTFLVFYGLAKAVRHRVTDSPPIHTLLGFSEFGVVVYVVLGLVNQVSELLILEHGGPIWIVGDALRVSGLVRGLLLPLFVLPLLIGLIQLERQKKPQDRLVWWRGTGTTYRVLIVVVVLHAVLLLVSIPGAQSEDASRLWLRNSGLAAFGLVMTSILSLSLGTIALRLGSDANPKRDTLGRAGTLRLAGIGLVLIVAGLIARSGLWAVHRQAWGAGVLSVGVLVLVVALLSLPLATEPVAGAAGTAVGADGRPADSTTTRAAPGAPPVPAPEIVEPTEHAKELVPAILVMVPLTTLMLSLIRASMPSIMGSHSSGWLIVYSAIAAALAVFGFCLARRVTPWAFSGDKTATARRAYFFGIEFVLIVVCFSAYFLVVRDPWTWGPRLGVVAIIATFLTSLVVVFGTLGYLMESRKLPAALDFIGLRRLPVILGLVVLGLLSHQFARGGYHNLKTIPDAVLPEVSQITAEAAFGDWLRANLPTDGAANAAVPMVFVAAAGGGIKAATFTSAVLSCIFVGAPERACSKTDAWKRLFVASGASGGSVGIASVLAERTNGPLADDWISQRLGKDLLSPELAWQMFVEIPNAVASFDTGLDRAEILQESWRQKFKVAESDPGAAPFYTDRSTPTWSNPLVFFSGTNLDDGCRVNISAVRSAQRGRTSSTPTSQPTLDPPLPNPPLLNPGATRRGSCKDQRVITGNVAPDQAGTRDLADYLCGRNIDLATAAFLSARFPAVSPTGTIQCDNVGDETSDSLSIGDGGYRDNSGAGSIMDTWRVLQPLVTAYNQRNDHCIVPIFLEINNGYSGYGSAGPASAAAQLVAPLLGAANVFSDLSYGPIEQAAAEFSRPLAGGVNVLNNGVAVPSRFFRVSLVDHPGVTAPLGWSLSGAAVDDLVGQLDLPENSKSLTDLRGLLSPTTGIGLTCQPS